VNSEDGGKLNRVKEMWRERQCAFGAIATIPSVQSVQVMARTGLDSILIDMEHGPIDFAAAHAMIAATLRHTHGAFRARVRGDSLARQVAA